MGFRLQRLVPSIAALAMMVAGSINARAEAADQPFGSLSCVREEHRQALVTDVFLWEFDAITAACIERFGEEGTKYWKGEFNKAVEPWRQKTYAVVAYQVFGPLYGDDAPKARLQFLTDLSRAENQGVIDGLTVEQCRDVTKEVYDIANEATPRTLGPTLDTMIAEAMSRSIKGLPSCAG